MRTILMILLIPLAVVIIQSRKLKQAIILLSLFSLIISIVYLLYYAPDVAIAEAVIGTTLSTLLFLVALKKYRVFSVYISLDAQQVNDAIYFERSKDPLIENLSKFCSKEGLELHAVYTVDSVDILLSNHPYAVIIDEIEHRPILYINENSLKSERLYDFLTSENISVQLVKREVYL